MPNKDVCQALCLLCLGCLNQYHPCKNFYMNVWLWPPCVIRLSRLLTLRKPLYICWLSPHLYCLCRFPPQFPSSPTIPSDLYSRNPRRTLLSQFLFGPYSCIYSIILINLGLSSFSTLSPVGPHVCLSSRPLLCFCLAPFWS